MRFMGMSLMSLSLAGIAACGGSGDAVDNVALERDSLRELATARDRQIAEMTMYFDSVASCLDSIATTEHLLLPMVNPETMKPYSKREIKERLTILAEHISRQREKIRQLTDSVDGLKNLPNGAGAANTVLFLTRQLEEKEAAVARLMKELNEKDRSIRDLTRSVDNLKSELTDVQAQNSALSSAVVEQSEMMNEAYMLVGDKKSLQSAGVLTKGGLFKKSAFNASAVNLSQCQKVDIRHVREIPMSGKPKILSAVPKGSFHWIDTAGGRTLVIDNPTKFWSLSNILVIQL